MYSPNRSIRRSRPTFILQIIPGVVGGVASAMCLYPLEVCETLMQGAAASGKDVGSGAIDPRRPDVRILPGSMKMGSIASVQPVAQAEMPNAMIVARKALASGALLHGADMALLCAVFGYVGFFGMFEATAWMGDSVGMLATRNLCAGFMSFLMNTPFQLLKTGVVLSGGKPALALARSITYNHTKMGRLWRGLLANSLGVLFIAAQFTLYPLLAGALTCQGAAEAAMIGMLATALAAAITYPVISVRTAVMSRRDDADERAGGALHCVRQIFAAAVSMFHDGTLYNGVVINVLRNTLPSGVLFGVKFLLTA